ncbi:hypothetical protein CHMI_01081 [Cellulomonas hominis]|nr:hypothetical protein CHMI_01081 [Cellulomonas hominis]
MWRGIRADTAPSRRYSGTTPSGAKVAAPNGRTNARSESASSTRSSPAPATAASFTICCATHPRTGGSGRRGFTHTFSRGTLRSSRGTTSRTSSTAVRPLASGPNSPRSADGTTMACRTSGGANRSTERLRSTQSSWSGR